MYFVRLVLALLALVLYPIVWLLLLPFRIVGIAVNGVLELLWAIVTLPARLLGSRWHLLLPALSLHWESFRSKSLNQ